MPAEADRLAARGDLVLVTILAAQRLAPIAALEAYTSGAGPFVLGALALFAALLGAAHSMRASRLARMVFSFDVDRSMLAIGARSPARIRGGSHDAFLGAIWRAIHARQMLVKQSEPSFWASAIALPFAGILVAFKGIALASVVLGAFAVGTLVRIPLSRRHRARVFATYELYSAVVSDMGHAVRGLDDLQAHGLTDALRRQLQLHAANLGRAESAAARSGAWATWLPLVSGASVLVVYVAARGGVGSNVILDAAWLAALGPIAITLARALVDRTKYRTEARVLDALCELGADLPEKTPETSPSSLAPFELDSVTFRYPAAIDADALGASATTTPEPRSSNALVLEDVTLRWEAHKPLALVGANGSGKTTVIGLLLRLVDPTEGVVRIGGLDVRSVKQRAFRDAVAYVPQRPLVLEGMTVREAVQLVAPVASDDRILGALGDVGLRARLESRGGDPLSVKCAALSVGEAQRVALARALVREAKLLVLDEPEAGLDPDARRAIRALLDRLVAQGRMLVVATQHEEVIPSGASILRLPLERAARVTLP